MKAGKPQKKSFVARKKLRSYSVQTAPKTVVLGQWERASSIIDRRSTRRAYIALTNPLDCNVGELYAGNFPKRPDPWHSSVEISASTNITFVAYIFNRGVGVSHLFQQLGPVWIRRA